VHGDQVIGTAVPASSEPATVKRAAGDQRSDLRRQDWEEPSGSYRTSREEAPEESIFLKRDAAPGGSRIVGEQSGTREWSTQEGPRNIGRFWLRGTSVPDAGPERLKDQRTFGPRSLVDRSGSSQEGAVRWKATPELVSQDRERVGRAKVLSTRLRIPAYPSLGACGGWQQCRPPFLLGQVRAARFPSRTSPLSASVLQRTASPFASKELRC